VNKGYHGIIISGLFIALLAVAIPLSSESFAKPDKCPTWPNCDDKGGGGEKTLFDFDISLSPNSISIDQRTSKTIDVLVSQVSGSGNVNLSAANLPVGVTVSFNSTSSKISSNKEFSSIMTIDVSSTANSGTIDVQVSGKGITKTSTLNLDIIVVIPPPPPPPSGDPVVVAAGDIVCNTSKIGTSTCHYQATSDLVMSINPDAVLTLGDNQYQKGELANYNTYYHPTWGRAFDKTYPSPGNHDYGTSYAAGYFDYFGTRAVDESLERNGYYSFDIGSWHIVSLNSNCNEKGVGDCSTTSTQGIWLENDLDTHGNACTLAYWHHPTFSAGSHGDNSEMEDFWQLLVDNQVDVALASHDHNYQRFSPMNVTGSEDPNGVREFVVGTGGKSHYSIDEVPSPTVGNLEVLNTSTFGVLKMTLHDTSYDWEFVGESGNTIDSGTWNCNVN
jgi:hypothetical protein